MLGGLIDYGTGAVYDLQPNPLFVKLTCAEESVQPAAGPIRSIPSHVPEEPVAISSGVRRVEEPGANPLSPSSRPLGHTRRRSWLRVRINLDDDLS